MNIKHYVEDLDIQLGQTYRGKCPSCKRPNTFTAKNDMGNLLWNCYSNSCNVSGATRTNVSAATILQMMRGLPVGTEEEQDFVMPPYIVSDQGAEFVTKICQQYQLDAKALNLMYDIREDRVVFPIEHGGKIVDAVGRAMLPNIQPKWRRYGTRRTAFLRGTSRTVFVVEDCISAAVVETLGGTGFAILGTTLLAEHKALLQDYGIVAVALDPDALSKTLEYTRELRSWGIDAIAMNLYDDIKYRNESDIKQIKRLIGV